uniref:SFRICE_033449 n=1 Tax=Spodoptera frugiperda TaxID=7108 RepID=A0A2H1W777_SPOFR
MNNKIFGALKRFYAVCFRDNQFSHRKCRTPVPHLQSNYPKRNTIKLATVQITPTLKLLSFRVSKNYLYLSLARPGTDLLEFKELCTNEG